MKAMLITMAVVAMLLGAALFTGSTATDTTPEATPYATVEYREFVAGMTDCGALQAFFDRAETNLNPGFMQIAHDQMRKVACYTK